MIAGIYNNVQIDVTGKIIAAGNQNYLLSQENGQVSFFDIATGTVIPITTAGDGSSNFVHINPTTVLSLANNFDNGGSNNGSLAYKGQRTSTFSISATVSYKPFTANDTFIFALAKNGTVVSGSKTTSNVAILGDLNTISVVSLMELTLNDTITLVVSNYTSADDLSVFALNITAHG
jgi:hypothetical protein